MTTNVSKAPSPAVKARSTGSTMWLQGLACGALLTFAAPTALLLTMLLAPAAVCVLAEAGARRSQTRAVALACAAASLAPVWHLWFGGDHMQLALAYLAQPAVLLTAWGAGAAAWASCQILPILIRSMWNGREAARKRSIEAELEDHRQNWRLEES